MSTPRKQLPPEIYLRRRVAALVAVLVLVIVLIAAWAFIGRGTSEQEAAPAAMSTSADAAPTSAPTSETVASEPAAESSAAPAPESVAESETAAPVKDTCELADLEVTASSDKPTYEPGEQPRFIVSVRNPTAADCVIDLGDNPLRFEVYGLASYERIWSDIDCNAPVSSGRETFPAGEETLIDAVWARTLSAPGQCEVRPAADPGSYRLHAVIGDNNSPAYTFNLR